jgi:hypothetical protein
MFEFLSNMFRDDPGHQLEGNLGKEGTSRKEGILRSPSGQICLRRLTDGKPLIPDECYIRIEVNHVYIPYQRIGTKRYHACVHGCVTLNDARAKDGVAGFQIVSSSKLAEKDGAHADRILMKDLQVLKNAPYRGDVRFQIGLMSMESEGSDLLDPYLSLLTKLSDAAGVSVVQQALHFVRPIQDGLNLLVGAHKGLALEVGLDASTDPVISGTYLLIRDDPTKAQRFEFRDDQLHDPDSSQPVLDVPYLVFSIRGLTHRNDWRSLPDLRQSQDAFNRVLSFAARNQKTEDEQLIHFRRACIACQDLIPRDAVVIADQEEARFKLAVAPHQMVASSDRPKPWSLDELKPFPDEEDVF